MVRLAMNIELIQQNELTAEQRDVLAQDRERWQRMGAGRHLDDWMAFGPGQLIRRSLAMKIAHTNKPEGRTYTETMRNLLHNDGMHTMDKNSLTAVLWLHENPEHLAILNEIRNTMTEGERSRLNSPITARQRVQKILKKRANKSDDNPHISPLAELRHQLLEKNREIEDLKERLAAAENGGSLFDLKRDKVGDIVATIIGSMSASRVKQLRDGLSTSLKSKPKPAG
jgi:hypothetical protein